MARTRMSNVEAVIRRHTLNPFRFNFSAGWKHEHHTQGGGDDTEADPLPSKSSVTDSRIKG